MCIYIEIFIYVSRYHYIHRTQMTNILIQPIKLKVNPPLSVGFHGVGKSYQCPRMDPKDPHQNPSDTKDVPLEDKK